MAGDKEISLCDVHDNQIQALMKTIHGNGESGGMKSDIAVIKQRVNLLLWIVGIIASATMIFLVTRTLTHIN